MGARGGEGEGEGEGSSLYPLPPCTMLLFKFGSGLLFFYPIFPVWPIGLDSEHLFKLITIIDWMDTVTL